MNRMTLTAWPTAVVMLLALTLLGACEKQSTAPEPARPVRTQLVAPQTVDALTTYAGDVRARYESNLGFRVAGKLITRGVNVGDTVKPGHVLAQLDPQDLQLSRKAQEAQLAGASANFEQAKADLERFKQLLEQKFISPTEFDRHQTAFQVARAQYQQAKAQLEVGSNQAAYALLKADQTGVVTAVLAEAGQVVAAGQPVIRVADPREKEVVINVPESRLDSFLKTKQFTVSLWANPGVTYPASLREVAPEADGITRTYAVRIRIQAPDQAVKLGMTANVAVASAGTPLLHLPLSALYQTGKQATVWVVDEKTLTVKQQPVEVARFDGNGVVLSSGLRGGERIVTAGVTRLINGQKVRLLEEAAP